MQKIREFLKTILWFVIICAVVSVAFWSVSKITSVKNWVSSLFNFEVIDVNSFDGANINYNGGLTKGDIDKQKNSANCPTLNDIYDSIHIIDYDNFVCFYKTTFDSNGKIIYPNILFVKTADGLKFDGALNMHGEEYAGWFGIGQSFTVEQQYSKVPEFDINSLFIFDNPKDNFVDSVGFSGFISRAVDLFANRQARIDKAREYVVQNIYPYFLTFYNQNVEIIQGKDTASGDFNAFYDYLYRNATKYFENNAGYSNGIGDLVAEVSDLVVYLLPDELKETYPIPNTTPTEYFEVYKVNVYIVCQYQQGKQTVDEIPDYVFDGVGDEPITSNTKGLKPMHSVTFKLSPKSNYVDDVIKNAIKGSPITISIYDSNGDKYRDVYFNETTLDNLNAVSYGALESGHYTYEIDSGALIFESYSGTIDITKSGLIEFKYTYQNGKVYARFTISPVSNDVDYSNIDLATYPVRLILNSEDKTQTYQFVFDTQSKVLESQTSLMPTGRYSYTILSEKLIFGSTSGNIEITTKNRNFDFSFGLVYNRSDLDFSVVVSERATTNEGYLYLQGNSSSVQLLGQKLGEQNYYVNVTIFDNTGNIVEALTHSHTGSGGCSEIWPVDNLVDGVKYTAQMTYASAVNTLADNYVEYQSATFTFTYKTKVIFTFTYSCTEAQN